MVLHALHGEPLPHEDHHRHRRWRVSEAASLSGLYQVIGFADDNPAKKGLLVDGLPVLGPWVGCEADSFIVAIGNNPARKATYENIRNYGRELATVISPLASVSSIASVEKAP